MVVSDIENVHLRRLALIAAFVPSLMAGLVMECVDYIPGWWRCVKEQWEE